MNQRPIAVTGIAGLFVVTGIVGVWVHGKEILVQQSFHWEDPLLVLIPLLAILAGVFMLLRRDWARWLALLWMASHVAISFFDSMQKVVMHAVIFLLIAYALLRADSRAYFRPSEKSSG